MLGPLAAKLKKDEWNENIDAIKLAELLAEIRSVCTYNDLFTVDCNITEFFPPKRLPKKFTKIHKYLLQLPASNKHHIWHHHHEFIDPFFFIVIERIGENSFSVSYNDDIID